MVSATAPSHVAGMKEGAEAERRTQLCFVLGRCKSISSPGHTCTCVCQSKGASLQLEQRLQREPGEKSLLGGFTRPLCGFPLSHHGLTAIPTRLTGVAQQSYTPTRHTVESTYMSRKGSRFQSLS